MTQDDARGALEAACLEGLISTRYGWRYRPAVGADAVERIIAAREADAEQRGINQGVRLAAQLVRDHVVSQCVGEQIGAFLDRRADRIAGQTGDGR